MTNAAVQKEAFPLAGGLATVNVQTLAKLSMLSLTKPDMGTAPVISGQLRVSFRPAQTLRNSFGVSRSLPGRLTYRPRFDYRETRELANWMMLFNSGELPESSNSLISSKSTNGGHRPIKGDYCSCSLKPENYSGSAEHYRYSGLTEHKQCLGSLVILGGCTYENQQVKYKQKGSTANAALWDDCCFNHEENHEYPALEDAKSCGANRPAQNLPGISGEPERIARSKSVQTSEFSCAIKKGCYVKAALLDSASVDHSSGASTFALRRSALSFLPQASSTQAEKLALAFSGFSLSTLASISSISSFGNLIPLYVDLPFLFPVAISKPMVGDSGVYTKYNMSRTKKRVDLFTHHELILFTHLIHRCCTNSEARKCLTTNQASNYNDRPSIEAAMSDHITPLTGRNFLSPNKFTWRFLALGANTRNVIHITAATEREARDQSPAACVMVFAGRLPVQEVRHA